MAVLTGFILRKTHLKGQASPLILELPAYHKPTFKRLYKETLMRLRFFIFRAGKLIIPICVILGGLNAITFQGEIISGDANAQSLLSIFGQWMTPLFAPMGINQDNWPATVGLLTGMLAKEVVVGTLNSLYSQMGTAGNAVAAHFDLFGGLKMAVASIGHNFSQLGSALWNPVLAKAPVDKLSKSMYGIIAQRFDGQTGAFAYLLFILLYIPCVSTMAVIRQEANRFYMWTSVIWSLLVAYAAAVIFYQVAHCVEHPQQSIFWVLAMVFVVGLSILLFHWSQNNPRRGHAITTT